MPESVIPDSVVPDSTFACYAQFRCARFPQAEYFTVQGIVSVMNILAALKDIVKKDQGKARCFSVDISKNRILKHYFEVDYSAVSKSAPSKMN